MFRCHKIILTLVKTCPVNRVRYIIPIYVFLISGEFYEFRTLYKKSQRSKNSLIGTVYKNENKDHLYKLDLINNAKCDVAFLGASRVLGYRQEFFNNSVNFVNAGRGATTLWQITYFIDHIKKNRYPKLLVVSLEQWYFNGVKKTESDYSEIEQEYFSEGLLDCFYLIKDQSLNVYKDLFIEKKYNLSDLTNFNKSHRYGIRAQIKCFGYRKDGSMNYGAKMYSQGKGLNFMNESLKDIRNGRHHFEYGDKVSNLQVRELLKIIKLCKEKQINLMFLSPPFAPKAYKEIQKKQNQFGYLEKSKIIINSITKKNDIEYYDLTDPKIVQISNYEFIDDCYHGTEVNNAKILVYLASKNKLLKNYVKYNFLKYKINNRTNNYYIFNPVLNKFSKKIFLQFSS